MKEIHLNFPSFFNCVIKDNTPLANSNSVSILLIGCIRPNDDSNVSYLSDTTVSQYIAGSVKIRASILDPLQAIPQAEAVNRIKQLGLKDYEQAAVKCIALLLHSKEITPTILDTLFAFLNDKSYNIEDRCCNFIAAVFLRAIHCKPKEFQHFTRDEKVELSKLEIPDNAQGTVSELLQSFVPATKSYTDSLQKLANETLWVALQEKLLCDDSCYINGPQQLAEIQTMVQFAITRIYTIQDDFLMYANHGEAHIINILRLMANLLGPHIDELSYDELTLLILSAYCHDIGLSFEESERVDILRDRDRLDQYLDAHKEEYIKAYSNDSETPVMSDEMLQKYLRYIQHERVAELLYRVEWPELLERRGLKEDVIGICLSHRRATASFDHLDIVSGRDLRFCAILLRIADLMDFDTSRAPDLGYNYWICDNLVTPSNLITKSQWREYQNTQRFDFNNISSRAYPYDLDYNARSKYIQIEQVVNCYLDWLNQELINCSTLLTRFVGKWQNFVLPAQIKRRIIADGYISGQYHFTLDQDRVLALLVGEELYSDPSVFARELLQNAIDAVRTRQQLDKNLPRGWKPQIKIRTWLDQEGYYWFRIEDNGIGMTEDIIKNFFLKVGSSYYSSNEFRQEKLRCRADPDYLPISRFGIGILSCFMGKAYVNQVEVSTKRFSENGNYSSALRLSMQGMSGYYYLASKSLHHIPGPMKGISLDEQCPYMEQAGTAIAVRTNLYQSEAYTGFKEILDKYIVYSTVPIHYDGDEGSFDYVTEQEFMDKVYNIAPSNIREEQGIFEFTVPTELFNDVNQTLDCSPPLVPLSLKLKCVPLDLYTKSPNLTGAILMTSPTESTQKTLACFGKHQSLCTIVFGFDVGGQYGEFYAWVAVNFPHVFENEMGAKVSQLEEYDRDRNKNNLYDKLKWAFRNELKEKISEMLIFRNLQYKGWEDDILKEYGVTREKFDQTQLEVSYKIQELSPSLPWDNEEIESVRRYKKAVRGWRFKIGKLPDFEWYNRYFANIFQMTGESNVVAHNGILCGNADFFCSAGDKNNVLGLIMLLKDKYRPDLYVARNGIQDVPLELASDLVLIQKALKNGVSNFNSLNKVFGKTVFTYLPAKTYWDLLDSRPDLCEQLEIFCDGRYYSINDLPELLEANRSVEMANPALLYGLKTMESLYKCLCAAYLRKRFALRIAFGEYTGFFPQKIHVISGEDHVPLSYAEIFPAQFFLLPVDKSCIYLTTEFSHSRLACNAKHRLSKFIIQNSSLLQKFVPGILTGLIRTLAEDNGTTLIENVNNLIGRLRKFNGFQIEVPIGLELTLDDLY